MAQQEPTRRPLAGVAFMLAAMAVLPIIDVFAKYLGQQQVPIAEVVWGRMFFGAVMTLPFAWRKSGARALVPSRPIYQCIRAILLMTTTFTFFTALKYMPIADTLAIFFIQPLIVTLLSPMFLNETVGARRWIAVLVGFTGTLIMIRPGFQAFNPGSLLALLSGCSMAVYFVMTHKITGHAAALVNTFQTNASGALIATLAIGYYWQSPTPQQWAMLVSIGFIATFGHYLIARAYEFAEASLLAPLSYCEMVMATALGWWFFDDLPDRWTIAGVCILIGSAIYLSLHERAASRKIAPSAPHLPTDLPQLPALFANSGASHPLATGSRPD